MPGSVAGAAAAAGLVALAPPKPVLVAVAFGIAAVAMAVMANSYGLGMLVVAPLSIVLSAVFSPVSWSQPGLVDPATVFHLASVSKPLSSTVVAGAVGMGLVKWTDAIVTYLPSLALADPYVTAHVTFADLFSHESGLPDHAGDLLEDLGYDQAYILNRLRLEPLAPFRANYAYTQVRPHRRSHGRRGGGRPTVGGPG